MAFGFFKKKEETAETVYINGKFYTQNPDQPWASAVACAGGRIIAVGDGEACQALAGDETEVIDLAGGTVLPGFIDVNGSPSYRCFKESFKEMEDLADFDEFLGRLADMCDVSTMALGGFEAFGGQEPLFLMVSGVSVPEEMTGEELRTAIDERTGDRPLLAIFRGQGAIMMNTAAAETVKAFAEQNQIMQVGMPVIIEALELVDFEEAQQAAVNLADEYCEKGFTSVVNNGFMEYFDAAYTDMILEMQGAGLQKQRLYGKAGFSGPVDPHLVQLRLRQKQVYCQEMEGLINESGLLIKMGPAFDDAEDELRAMCMEAAQNGFNVKVNADTDEHARMALEILGELAVKGYKKVTFTLAHHAKFTEEERINHGLGTSVLEAGPISMDYLASAEPANVSAAVDVLTFDAAVELGILEDYGSIEVGKKADFAVFEENPLNCPNLKDFCRTRAVKTIIDGDIVYDEDVEVENEWYELLSKQQY